MKGEVFLRQYLIWVNRNDTGSTHKLSWDSRNTQAHKSIKWDPDLVLPTWTNDTKSDCCGWEGLECNRTSGRATKITLKRFKR